MHFFRLRSEPMFLDVFEYVQKAHRKQLFEKKCRPSKNLEKHRTRAPEGLIKMLLNTNWDHLLILQNRPMSPNGHPMTPGCAPCHSQCSSWTFRGTKRSTLGPWLAPCLDPIEPRGCPFVLFVGEKVQYFDCISMHQGRRHVAKGL